MLNICQMLNLTTHLDNTSLAHPVTKQCFMLVSVCVKRALAITEKLELQLELTGMCLFG